MMMGELNVEWMHDFRMPLQLVYSCAQMIQIELNDSALPAGKYVDMLMENVMQLQRMLNHALTEDRRLAGGDQMHMTVVDVMARMREICTSCRIYAEKRGVKLRYSGDVAALNTALDEDKFSRVLLNLISNAIKFTPWGGSIHVNLRALGDFFEISVCDTGMGIAPDRLEKIFRRGETDGGYGHGLFIAREYAQCMGGDVGVESDLGSGSTFTMRLPVHSLARAVAGIREMPQAEASEILLKKDVG